MSKNILDHNNLNMTAPPVEGQRIPAALKIGLWNNNPQLTIFTGGKGAANVVRAGLDGIAFSTFLSMLEEYAYETDPNKQKEKDHYAINTFDRDKQLKSKLVVGRDDKGMLYVSIIEPGKDWKLRFDFSLGIYHKIQRNGEDLDKGAASRLAAKGRLHLFRNLIPVVMSDAYVEPSQNSNYNKNKSNNGSNSSVDDSDLPF